MVLVNFICAMHPSQPILSLSFSSCGKLKEKRAAPLHSVHVLYEDAHVAVSWVCFIKQMYIVGSFYCGFFRYCYGLICVCICYCYLHHSVSWFHDDAITGKQQVWTWKAWQRKTCWLLEHVEGVCCKSGNFDLCFALYIHDLIVWTKLQLTWFEGTAAKSIHS